MNDVALKEYIEGLIAAYEKHSDEQWIGHRREHELLKEAINRAGQVLETRLETMNEFRNQLNAERGSYLTLAQYEAKHEVATNRITELEKFKSNMEGRFGTWTIVLAIATLLINFLFRLWPVK
jgi:hypothetical protein